MEANGNLVDWETYETPKRGSGQTELIFVKAKACPLTFRPVGKLLPYRSVFDSETRRSREPKSGEKSTLSFLVNGLNEAGEMKVYQIGSQIYNKMKDLFEELDGPRPVTVSAEGTGMATEYRVKSAKGVKIDVPAEAKLFDLEGVRNRLLGPAETSGATPASSEDMTSMIRQAVTSADGVNI